MSALNELVEITELFRQKEAKQGRESQAIIGVECF